MELIKNTSFNTIAKPKLETITKLMNALDNPQADLKIIHVAGTNGKGSVCAYLQSILTSSGFKTGKYSSPHMIEEYERISIDYKNISKTDFDILMEKTVNEAKKIFKDECDMPTQFELWTAVALSYFKNNKCDYVILETGLGGERDATNIIKSPKITVITQIALDHTELLGDTLEKIAKEKAGIIKKSEFGGLCVTINQDKSVLEVLKMTAQEKENDFIVVNPPIKTQFVDNCEVFDYKHLKNIKSRMLGEFQRENAALAIECAIYLGICDENIIKGIYNAKNIGRFEILNNSPLVIFDGAHNPNAMSSLLKSLNKYYPKKKFNFIIGFMNTKDIDNSILEFSKNGFEENLVFYTVQVQNNTRAEKSDALNKRIKNFGFDSIDAKNMKNALSLALSDDRVTVICGSLYLYKEFFSHFSALD